MAEPLWRPRWNASRTSVASASVMPPITNTNSRPWSLGCGLAFRAPIPSRPSPAFSSPPSIDAEWRMSSLPSSSRSSRQTRATIWLSSGA